MINNPVYGFPYDLKKRVIRRAIFLVIGIIAITGIIIYNYDIDQINARGKIFGDMLKSIQDDLKTEQADFEIKLSTARAGEYTPKEFSAHAENHFSIMQDLVDRYEDLKPPKPYESATNLFKLSTISQLDRDRQGVLFITTGDSSYEIRAKDLHQESFEYELAALADYKAVQIGEKP